MIAIILPKTNSIELLVMMGIIVIVPMALVTIDLVVAQDTKLEMYVIQ
ncbi:MAG TPA: hypothetical protein VJR94_01650 [Candidatus Nitrosocosmicus sp.]|nr:hypothetical protein [Candidatus Nitrosocosmicus sp.]